jgi:hypothetical protein
MPNYLRGQAYLRLQEGKEAATEFQKIVDHPGIAPLSPIPPWRDSAAREPSPSKVTQQRAAPRVEEFRSISEGRGLWYPHPRASQGRVRRVAVARKAIARGEVHIPSRCVSSLRMFDGIAIEAGKHLPASTGSFHLLSEKGF